MTRTFASLGDPQFRRLWLSSLAYDAGEFAAVGHTLLFLHSYGHSLTDLVLLLFLAVAVPRALVGTFAGVIADWYNRRRVLLVAYGGASLTMAGVALLVFSGLLLELWHLYIMLALVFSLRPLVHPSRSALIASLAPDYQLTNAVALLEVGSTMARGVGALVAGTLFYAIGYGAWLGGMAAMFLIAWFVALRMRTPPQASVERKSPRIAVRALIDAGKHAWRTLAIRWVIILALVFAAFAQTPLKGSLPVFARAVLGLSPGGLGTLLLASAAGGIVGALVLATINPNRRRGVILVRVMVATGTLLIGLSFSDRLPLMLVLLALLGAGVSGFSIVQTSALLAATPEAMRGRIMGILAPQWLLVTLLGSAAAAGFGMIYETLSAVLGFLMYGAICGVIGIVVLRLVPAIRRIG